MPVEIKVLYNTPRLGLGEGPHWDSEKQELLYVDIMGKTVVRYVPATKESYKVELPEWVSLIVPVAGSPDKYVVTQKGDVFVMEWDGTSDKPKSLKKLHSIIDKDHPATTVNDGKCDSKGRLWTGTVAEGGFEGKGTPTGAIFSVDLDGMKKNHGGAVTLANGLGWSPDDKTMYYIDSLTLNVDAFDYDVEKGAITNRRTIYSIEKNTDAGAGPHPPSPDGMTVDSDGNLWVALCPGGKVIKIDPIKKERLLEIPFPIPTVTSCCFGGPNMDILYVTSISKAGELIDVSEKCKEAGYLIEVTGLGVKGLGKGSLDCKIPVF